MNMRKWHRWLAAIFGVFTLWMAATGLIIHANDLLKHDDRPAVSATAHALAFTCPPDYTCRPRPKGGPGFASFVKNLHSGKAVGPLGTLLSILSGAALLFFSGSGLWMYWQMWSNRRARALQPRWFWK